MNRSIALVIFIVILISSCSTINKKIDSYIVHSIQLEGFSDNPDIFFNGTQYENIKPSLVLSNGSNNYQYPISKIDNSYKNQIILYQIRKYENSYDLSIFINSLGLKGEVPKYDQKSLLVDSIIDTNKVICIGQKLTPLEYQNISKTIISENSAYIVIAQKYKKSVIVTTLNKI